MSEAEPKTPSAADFALTRAFAAHRDGKLDKAEAGYREVLELDPLQPDAMHMLGLIHKNRGELDEAERCIRRSIELRPEFAAAHYNLGNLLADQGRSEEATASYKSVIAQQNNYPEAYYGLGNVLRERGDYKAAAASFGLAVLIKPDYMEARHNRANMLRELGKVEESITELEKVVAMAPDLPEAHYNLALSLFMAGRYAAGKKHYDWRFKTKGFSSPDRKLKQPLWDGTAMPTKTLLLYAEQGLGDTLQFIRYARVVRPRVGQLIVEVPANLQMIVAQALGELAYVVVQGKPLPPFDVQAPLLSLVGIFGDEMQTPVVFPYLKAEPERVAAWGQKLQGKPGLKVGINWQGNPAARIDRGRSVPLQLLKPLFAVPGVRFISLQKNAGTEQLQDLPAGMNIETLGTEFDAGPDAFLDAAAVLRNLDLFITSDTALAHLAGALECPTWLLLKRVPDWRWGLNGDVTHWYKKTKLFRQTEPGEWSAPIQAMARALESWQSGKVI